MKNLIITVLVCSAAAFGQFGAIRNALPGAQAAQSNAPGPGEADVDEGTIQGYLEMYSFAEGLYYQLEGAADARHGSDFRRRVDTAFEVASREDMQRAFEMNTSAKSEVRYVIEDRFRVYSGLYDNPVVQALVNRVGQSVVPPAVGRLYTFKLVADPVPWAEALSTGTVWVSTGMVAMTKNKAQLAYVLAHEAAHTFLDHHKHRLVLQYAQEEYNRQQTENGEARRRKWNFIGRAAGATAGAVMAGDLNGAYQGSMLGAFAANTFANATRPRLLESIEWNRFEEDAADRLAFEWLLGQNLDVKQIPDVYLALKNMGERDPRIKLGFLGRTDRVRERLATVQTRLKSEQAKPEWAGRRLSVSDPDYDLLLAEVQRDNGVFALHYDMLDTARENLSGAVRVKTQDPTALYFYAKVLSQTGRTDAERNEADRYFRLASEADCRNQNYGSFLHRAIVKLTDSKATATDRSQAVDLLKQYLIGYHLSALDAARSKDLTYPPHLEGVYDYLARAGEVDWKMDEDTIRRAKTAIDSGVQLVSYRDQSTKKHCVQAAVAPVIQQPPRDAEPPTPPVPPQPKPQPPKKGR